MDDRATDQTAPGTDVEEGRPGVPARRPPIDSRTLASLIVSTCVVLPMAAWCALLSLLFYGYAAMCTDDYDPSDCNSAVVEALSPLALALVSIALVGLGWWRRRLWPAVTAVLLLALVTLYLIIMIDKA
jgi:hypothetical protein